MAVKLLAAAVLLVLQAQDQVQGLKVKGPGPTPPMGDPLPESKCYDKHVKCSEWAKDGECKDNPTWMRPNCMVSCGQCAAIGGDSDVNENCIKWAKEGECDINYNWMFFNCPKSCDQTGKRLGAWRSESSINKEL